MIKKSVMIVMVQIYEISSVLFFNQLFALRI